MRTNLDLLFLLYLPMVLVVQLCEHLHKIFFKYHSISVTVFCVFTKSLVIYKWEEQNLHERPGCPLNPSSPEECEKKIELYFHWSVYVWLQRRSLIQKLKCQWNDCQTFLSNVTSRSIVSRWSSGSNFTVNSRRARWSIKSGFTFLSFVIIFRIHSRFT